MPKNKKSNKVSRFSFYMNKQFAIIAIIVVSVASVGTYMLNSSSAAPGSKTRTPAYKISCVLSFGTQTSLGDVPFSIKFTNTNRKQSSASNLTGGVSVSPQPNMGAVIRNFNLPSIAPSTDYVYNDIITTQEIGNATMLVGAQYSDGTNNYACSGSQSFTWSQR